MITTDCHTEPVEVLLSKDLMVQGAVTPVKHRCCLPRPIGGVAFRSSVVLLLNR